MNAAMCPVHECPQRECLHPPVADAPDPDDDYATPILVFGVVAALGYVCLGASLVFLGVLAWHALRGGA